MSISIIVLVFMAWYGLHLGLNTQYPVLAVASGSMCTVQYMNCDGYSHPFGHTLHVGDLIIVQGVAPENIKAAEDGDIIVFRELYGNDLIVHRAIANEEINGILFFYTKGDGSTTPYPDPWRVPEYNVIGRVVFRIPWVGHLSLFLHNSVMGIVIIIFLIIVLLIIEFINP
jgi:signal peptidase I